MDYGDKLTMINDRLPNIESAILAVEVFTDDKVRTRFKAGILLVEIGEN